MKHIFSAITTFILVTVLFWPMSVAAQELRGVGVVLIHGKGGGQGPLQPLAAALRREGAVVVMPRMSWSSGYRTYASTVNEVAVAVAQAERQGAQKVFLAGHSMGANISLGYVAAGGRAAGVVALAPGHRPLFIAGVSGDSLERARAMVTAGRGRETAEFKDFNQGRTFPIKTAAEAYLSFFDPSGPAAAAAAAQGVRTPVLWVIGSSDRPAIQDQAPYTVGQRVVVDANHQTTPVQGVAQTVAWIKAN
ncbi:alpha/beta hydrolase [Candidatus Raskinella chloraquaticus]|uniref:AB hydrolase-1 domain-containing protein n=1 Tax=Candidatus Raskinella chloraquaticus TaxID=1951219 RepID=A0A1W9I1W5_9HYPH|nr:MAG: hypothetical protein A4S15_14510 [Proteobacteria bacterium SG_bin8]